MAVQIVLQIISIQMQNDDGSCDYDEDDDGVLELMKYGTDESANNYNSMECDR